MKNYKGRCNIEIINDFIYLINELFYNKEIVREGKTFTLFMGIYETDIELPWSEMEYLVNRTGIFETETIGFKNRQSYILRSEREILKWFNEQRNNYLLNEVNISKFEVAIKMLRRSKNLKKLKV